MVGSGEPVVIHKVWTFLIRGGLGFEVRLPRTPKCEHPPDGMTLWKLVGTQKVADATRALMEETGAVVDVYTEEQSAEQADIRRDLMGKG